MVGITIPPFPLMQKKADNSRYLLCISGKGGIRTPGTVARSPHFECGPFDHSGTFPFFAVQIYELF